MPATVKIVIASFLERHGFEHPNVLTVAAPISSGSKLSRETRHRAGKTDLSSCAAIAGSLPYFACATRPDLSFSASALARFMASPTTELLSCGYLACTTRLEPFLGGQSSPWQSSPWAILTVASVLLKLCRVCRLPSDIAICSWCCSVFQWFCGSVELC